MNPLFLVKVILSLALDLVDKLPEAEIGIEFSDADDDGDKDIHVFVRSEVLEDEISFQLPIGVSNARDLLDLLDGDESDDE